MQGYEKKECIGQGQFSRVYAGVHKSSGTKVALKLVPKPPVVESSNPDFISLASLKDEVKCQRALRHENILRLLACFDTEIEVVFVSELCSGDLLQLLKKNGKFSELKVHAIAKELVSGLHYLHENQYIHRDLKLQNILVGLDGKHKICDFGFTKKLDNRDMKLLSVKGTPIYMAPELIKEEPYTYLVDLWALGIILFELFHGLPPFYTTNIFNLVNLILNQSIKWPATMSTNFKDFLKGLLDKNSKTRLGWPFVMKHPFILNEIPNMNNNEIEDDARLSKRADSAIDIPFKPAHSIESKIPKAVLTKSVSLKDLILQDDCDFSVLNSRILQDYEVLYSDSELVGAFTSKLTSHIFTDTETLKYAETATIFVSKLVAYRAELLSLSFIQKSLKQIHYWMINLKKHYLLEDETTENEAFTNFFEQYFTAIAKFIEIDRNDSHEWVPNTFAQGLLPVISKLFKTNSHLLHTIATLRLFLNLISCLSEKGASIYIQDVLDLGLLEGLFTATYKIKDNYQIILLELLELSKIVLMSFSFCSSAIEQMQYKIITGLENFPEKIMSTINEILLDESNAHIFIFFELLKCSNQYIRKHGTNKSLLQKLLNMAASDQLSEKIRSESLQSICDIYQIINFLDTELTLWILKRMDSFLKTIDPKLKQGSIKSSPSKSSLIMPMNNLEDLKSDLMSQSLAAAKFCLGTLDAPDDSLYSLFNLYKNIKKNTYNIKNGSIIADFSQWLSSQYPLDIRMFAMLCIFQEFFKNPGAFTELVREEEILKYLGAILEISLDLKIKKKSFNLHIERYTGIANLLDYFLQSSSMYLYIFGSEESVSIEWSITLRLVSWAEHTAQESTHLLIFGLVVNLLERNSKLATEFTLHFIDHMKAHRTLLHGIKSSKQLTVQLKFRAFKAFFVHTEYLQKVLYYQQ